ncbi:MAG: LPS export ABC transporter periplasmic protein LptC [Deltaproteobacteria bacterium GWC2_42_11]|nr:MAG: LPS export ABC transporter periplasmic protein LptC [Deltaproteobacteria bacterium GWC2_42_11]HBO84481.1 LPS export ABC transporter periplasmic protein LptC [Deltaproteobacteria bacterium]
MKAKRTKILLAALLLASISAIGVSLFINFQSRNGIKDTYQKVSSNASATINNIHYIEDKNGRKEWELDALKAEYFKEDDTTIFEDVKVIFYAKDGKTFVVKGKRGKLVNQTKDVEINGDVSVISEDGYKLTTESLRFEAGIKQIKTDDRVFLTGSTIDVEGVGLLIDINKETVSVLKNVRTVLKNAKI